MNPIYARAIAEIRKTNLRRTIFVEPGNWGSIDELKNLALPPDDNVIVSVHCYEPFYFTHQGATWAGADTKVTGIQFPGPPATPLVPDPSLSLNRWVQDWIHNYNTLPDGTKSEQPGGLRGQNQAGPRVVGLLRPPGAFRRIRLLTPRPTRSRARIFTPRSGARRRRKTSAGASGTGARVSVIGTRKQPPMPGMREALFGK